MYKKILLYGFGNPGRQDDGLGPALVDKIEKENLSGIIYDSNYQLNIEDAHTISECAAVIFIDASVGLGQPFKFYKIEPASEITFTTHTVSPQSIMALAYDLYQADVQGYILEIQGKDWDFAEGLSEVGEQNLNEAYAFLKEKLKDRFDSAQRS